MLTLIISRSNCLMRVRLTWRVNKDVSRQGKDRNRTKDFTKLSKSFTDAINKSLEMSLVSSIAPFKIDKTTSDLTTVDFFQMVKMRKWWKLVALNEHSQEKFLRTTFVETQTLPELGRIISHKFPWRLRTEWPESYFRNSSEQRVGYWVHCQRWISNDFAIFDALRNHSVIFPRHLQRKPGT